MSLISCKHYLTVTLDGRYVCFTAFELLGTKYNLSIVNYTPKLLAT